MTGAGSADRSDLADPGGAGSDQLAAESVSRVRQAAQPQIAAETLRRLAADPELLVRAAVAINDSCEPSIDCILAKDDDERVRALLGVRITRLIPGLDWNESSAATLHVMKTLAALARDQAVRVRTAIADEIKSMEMAPRELVLLLAQDAVVEVNDPVLRLSPVLTDHDLLRLLATPPSSNVAESIASRQRLSATVSDAIVQHAGAPAIRTLLANQSACIQEATLDALIGRAPYNKEWHAPLVRRPNLSLKAVRALCEFIAADLLRILVERVDLDAAKLESVRQRLAHETSPTDDGALIVDAQHLQAKGKLTEDLLLEAALIGDSRRLATLLAVSAGVPLSTVDRVIELRSAKALVSLVWRSQFSMRAGTAVQSALAHFSPDHTLAPNVSGGFPLSVEEMEWQLELMIGAPLATAQHAAANAALAG